MTTVASYPGSSQFFNDARRKMREPGKIHHMRDIMWKGLGAAHAYISDVCWEKRDRKTVGLSKLDGKKCKYTNNLLCARFVNGVRTTPSPFHLMSRMWWILPGSLIFLCASLKNWEEPGDEANKFLPSEDVRKPSIYFMSTGASCRATEKSLPSHTM